MEAMEDPVYNSSDEFNMDSDEGWVPSPRTSEADGTIGRKRSRSPSPAPARSRARVAAPAAPVAPPSAAPAADEPGMTIAQFEKTMVERPAALRARAWTPGELDRLIGELGHDWRLDRDGMRPCMTTTWACQLFGVAEEDLALASNAVTTDHPAHIHRRILSKIGVVSTLLELVHHETFVPEEADAVDLTQRLGEVATVMTNAADLIRSACRLMCSLTTDPNAADPYVLGNRFLHLIQETRMTPLQSLLTELATVLLRNGWRQYEGRYYVPITVCINDEIYETHAWEDKMTVDSMITSLCDSNMERRRWMYITSGRDITRQAAQHLMASGPFSFEFPTLEFDRRLFAFTDGAYDGSTDTFYPHAERGLPIDRVAIKYFDHPMDSELPPADPPVGADGPVRLRWPHEPVDADFIALHTADICLAASEIEGADPNELTVALLDCLHAADRRSIDGWVSMFLDAVLHRKRTCHDVQHVSSAVWRRHESARHLCYRTPGLDRILFTQDFDMGTCSFIYAMVGRMMYEVGELDGWQIVPFVLGKGGSGKSTIMQLVRHMYPASCVGNISSNGEVKFGLSGVYGKFMWVCPEVRKDFALDQGEFQSMISGEEIVLNVKNQTARTVKWMSPGMMCGNQVFKFEDTQDSLFRRIVAVYFDKMVDRRSVDTTLYDRMINGPDAEFGRFVRKCNVAYRRLCADVGSRVLWDPSLVETGIVPRSLHTFRTKFRAEIDSIVAFLEESDEIHQDETRCMSMRGFQSRLTLWMRKHDPMAKMGPGSGGVLRDKLNALGYVVHARDAGIDLSAFTYVDPENFTVGTENATVKNKEIIIGLYYQPSEFGEE
jgi:hypothetical protein